MTEAFGIHSVVISSYSPWFQDLCEIISFARVTCFTTSCSAAIEHFLESRGERKLCIPIGIFDIARRAHIMPLHFRKTKGKRQSGDVLIGCLLGTSRGSNQTCKSPLANMGADDRGVYGKAKVQAGERRTGFKGDKSRLSEEARREYNNSAKASMRIS